MTLYHPKCLSNHTLWEPVEPALIDLQEVIAVRTKERTTSMTTL